jgi:hypothetical protein
MSWIKLVSPLITLAWVAWLYAKNGWRTGYKVGSRGEVPVDHDGTKAVAVEMQTRIGWPIWAHIELPATRRCRFHVRPEPRFRLRREIESGLPTFDAAFHIEPGSEQLVRAVLEREPLHRHFLSILRWLPREQSKLSRVVAEDGRIAVEFNVRWVSNRPRLYRRILAWMVELDRLLAVDATRPQVESRDERRP